MKYVCWDLETSTRTEFKRKANPFSAENYIVAQGACRGRLSDPFLYDPSAPAWTQYFPASALDDSRESRIAACKDLSSDWFTQHLDGTKLLVGVNIKFDLLYALANPNSRPEGNLQAWMDFVNGGGLVWDCQLAEYLLDGMEQSSHMLSMDEMAPRYGGDEKVDEVKALWNAGVDTIDIPEDLLLRYLGGGGDVRGDVFNTETIFRGQWDKAKAAGQLRSILMNMGALMFTVEVERNGMFIDRELGEQLRAKLAERLVGLNAELNKHIPEGLPFTFNWNSPVQKSALIFGGRVKYEAPAPVLDEHGEFTYYQTKETHFILQDGTTTSRLPMDEDDEDEHYVKFAGGKNKGELKTRQVTVPDKARGHKTRIEDHFYEFTGFTKPNPAWAGAVPGVYSTSSDVIEALGNRNIPFLKVLAEVTSMAKDLGTYYWNLDPKNGERKGMLTLVQMDSIIHHMLNMTSTVTARLSSSNPNLQTIPKGKTSDAKSMFISRWGVDGVICQSDFSSLEIYVQAILTHSINLLADLRTGKDMHCVRLAAKERMEYEEVLRLCKGKDVDPVLQKEWDYKRTGAKEFSFQRAYGAGVAAIVETTGMAEADVQALADGEDARYPELNEYFEAGKRELAGNRRPTSKVIPHPEVPGLNVQLGKSHLNTPDGKRYTMWESPAPRFLIFTKGGDRRRDALTANFSPTELKNYRIQGTGGEWAKAAMWLTLRAFYHYRNFDGKALLVNQVHDAIYGDFHNSVRAKAAALLHVCMEEASTFVEWWFKWTLPIGVPSDTSWGSNMMIEDRIEDPVYDKARAALTPWIRNRYIGGHNPSFKD
jgi:DNA polymerase-1